MKFPNKVTTFKESILYKCILILEEIKEKRMGINELYKKMENKILLEEFIDSICILFLLEKIKIEGEDIINVSRVEL